MNLEIEKIRENFKEDMKEVSSLEEVENIRIKYLGKSGQFSVLFKKLASFTIEEKKVFGPILNSFKKEIENDIEKILKEVENKKEVKISSFYKSLPGKKPKIGHLHITTRAIREIVEVFKPLGFNRARYNEIDWDYFAFESLNMPISHPARDEWETFFVKALEDKKYGKMVITPHTSSGQVREMLKGNLPIRMINIARCGRRQIDINHLPTFFQFEGLVIDKGISISHLKGTLDYFVKNFFGKDRKTRLRPYDFRFTEPSFETDISCDLCKGKGCRFCKGGWVELGGAGMVHPNVLKAGKIDPKKYSGFAFGWGVERTYMMKEGTKVDDIRNLYNNDFKFLKQF